MNTNTPCTHPDIASLSRKILGSIVLAATLSPALMAQGLTPTLTPTPTSLSESANESDSLHHSGKSFIMKVARASTNEVALSQLAASRSSNPDVKAFAQMMITDHTQANNDLGTLASSKGIDITKAVDKGNIDDVSSLSEKTGAEFDKAYAKKMYAAHEDAVKLFKKEATDGKDPEVVAFAAKYLETLSMHLEHARVLKDSLTQ
jgi:putative membrane protein